MNKMFVNVIIYVHMEENAQLSFSVKETQQIAQKQAAPIPLTERSKCHPDGNYQMDQTATFIPK